MPVNNIIDQIAGILSIGPRVALQALKNTKLKNQLDGEYLASLPELKVVLLGDLQKAFPIPSGGMFEFVNGNLEVFFLKPDVVRLSWQPGEPPLPYALEQESFPEMIITYEEVLDGYILETGVLTIHVHKDGSISFLDPAGTVLRCEAPPRRKGDGWVHQAYLADDERVYGLGERTGGVNKRGRSWKMWNTDPGLCYSAGQDPLYICIPACLSLSSLGSYFIFYENYGPGSISMDSDPQTKGLFQAEFDLGMLRYYFMPGPPERSLHLYTELTGRAPLPPRWALGYHQSRWGYTREADIRRVATGFEQLEIPLSAIHLDIDYMDGFRVFTVHKRRFPDLKKLSDDLSQRGIHLVSIIDPGVKQDEKYGVYLAGMAKGMFSTLPNGESLHGVVWPGSAAFPDFTNSIVRAWWGEQYRELVRQGVDGFWHDMNEPSSFVANSNTEMTLPLSARHSLEGTGGDHRQAHNLYGLLMNRAGYEGLQRLNLRKRPWILSRSGWAGLQRYAWCWTGDVQSSWEQLRQTIPTVLGLGLSGLPFCGPDAGGYFGSPSSELYLRWLQLSAFLPLFRGHSAKRWIAREPWNFGENALKIARSTIRLRHRLLPYFYTAAWQTNQTGIPMIRPLFWTDPSDPSLWDIDDSFLLGDSLLVAPILEIGASSRQVYLPTGKWYSFWDRKEYIGPGFVNLEGPLERIPVLVQEGTLIPMETGKELDLYAFGESTCTGVVYSDLGDGYGSWRLDSFTYSNGELKGETQGEFPFPYTRVHVDSKGVP